VWVAFRDTSANTHLIWSGWLTLVLNLLCVQLNPTVTREIKILQQLRHPNIVKLIEVVTSKCSIYEGTSPADYHHISFDK
jgi:serine/threonine protein kinase